MVLIASRNNRNEQKSFYSAEWERMWQIELYVFWISWFFSIHTWLKFVWTMPALAPIFWFMIRFQFVLYSVLFDYSRTSRRRIGANLYLHNKLILRHLHFVEINVFECFGFFFNLFFPLLPFSVHLCLIAMQTACGPAIFWIVISIANNITNISM